MSAVKFVKILLATLALATVVPVAAQPVAGRIQFVSGEVLITARTHAPRLARKADIVLEGDTLVTDASASAQLLMADGSLISLRPDTRLRIEKYHYAGPGKGAGRSVLELLYGGFRTITGLIAREQPNDYKIRTQTAIIGVRGTDHESFYIPPDRAGSKLLGPPGNAATPDGSQ